MLPSPRYCGFGLQWLDYTLCDKRSGNIITLVDSQSDNTLSASAALTSNHPKAPTNRHDTRASECQAESLLRSHPLANLSLSAIRKSRHE